MVLSEMGKASETRGKDEEEGDKEEEKEVNEEEEHTFLLRYPYWINQQIILNTL